MDRARLHLCNANLRVEHREELCATDASPGGAGSCVPPVTQEACCALCDLAGKENVRNFHTVSSKAKHMNFLELPSKAVSHVREQRHDRCWHLWIRAWGLGAVSKGRSSSRMINFLLRKLGFWCPAYDIALELVWVPTWANPADASSRNKPIKSWHASLPKPPPRPTAIFATVHALSEQNLLREPLSATAHKTRKTCTQS